MERTSPLSRLGTRVGDTPLVRSAALCERTGLRGLRLKLEGMNPTGTQKDRIAHLEVKEAVARNRLEITAASCGNYGVAVAHAASIADLPCTIFVPESFHGDRARLIERLGATVRREGRNYEESIQASRAHALAADAHNANPGGANTLRVLAGYSAIAEEILRQAGGVPTAVGVPVGNGTTLAGVHAGFRAAWGDGRTETVPAMIAGTSAGNNPLPSAWARKQRECTPLDPRAVEETRLNEPLVNWDALDGTACLTAVRDSHGAAYGLDDSLLLEYQELLLADGYDAHPASLAAVAALETALADGDIAKDDLVIAILTSGRSTIQVEQLSTAEADLASSMKDLRSWLAAYDDPVEEVEEAMQVALQDGKVLAARDNEGRIGYAVLTPMPFDEFFPRYHLSYIAVHQRARGHGVGTLLLEEAIRVTGGDLSLHVDTKNKNAIRLYEKLGFVAKYYRMLYRGPKGADIDPASGAGWSGHDRAEASPPEPQGARTVRVALQKT